MRFLSTLTLALFACAAAAKPQPELVIRDGDPELIDNIKAHLSIIHEPCSRPLARLRQFQRHIRREVDAAARALGYYQSRITALKLYRNKDCWGLTLSVEAGPRVRIAEIDLTIEGEAANDPEFDKLRRNLPLHPGDPLNHSQYEQLKLLFQNLAARRGYFDARFREHALRVDVQRSRAVIDLAFDSGPRYRIGAIRVRQDFLDPAFVRRYLNIKPGDPYEGGRIAEIYRRLADADLFQEIDIRTQPLREPSPRVPITVTLKPKKRHSFKAGIGFDTDTGPRIKFGYLNRYVNRYGHRFNSELKLSFIEPSLTAGYFIPLRHPEEHFSLNTGLRHLRLDTYRSNQATFNGAYTHPRGEWKEVISLGLSYEQSRFQGKAGKVASLLLTPSLHWTHKRQRQPGSFITKGRKFDFLASGGVAMIGDVSHHLKVHLQGNYIHSLPWRARILHRWELGAILAPRFGNVPASIRFFAGGNQSIRGYGYQRLGPKNDEGDVIGGRYVGTASLEYEQRLFDNWGLALFLDGGNAYDRVKDLPDQARFGAGIGVRWFSPFGVVRLDVATPVIRDDFGIRIHFALGPEL